MDEKKGLNFRQKIIYKINEKTGNIEETQMTPEYMNDVNRYDSYHGSLLRLTHYLEGLYQQDEAVIQSGKVVCLPNEDPMEKVKAALDNFKKFVPKDKVNSVQKVVGMVDKAAKTKRDFQLKSRNSIRHIRRFPLVEYKTFTEARDKFNEARAAMDLAKHEVKQAKTTEQVEKRAIIYQQKVEIFDEHCNKFIKVMEELPSIKAAHSKDILELLQTHKDYHQEMAKDFS